jgi:hypothetical protein
LKKEIEENYRRWRDRPCSWIGRINIVKMSLPSKASYMFNSICIKITMTFITETEKSTLNFIWKLKRLQTAKAIVTKKSNTVGITIPDFKLYYRAIAKNKNKNKKHQQGTCTKGDMTTKGTE